MSQTPNVNDQGLMIDNNIIILNSTTIRFCQTVSAPDGNNVTVQPVKLSSDGTATADGSPITVLCNWTTI